MGIASTPEPIAIIAFALYVMTSVVTFVVYAIDKHAAKTGAQRIPETTLHLLAIIGGWPGAYVAQKILRHKTMKKSFQTIFLACIFLNLACFAVTLIHV